MGEHAGEGVDAGAKEPAIGDLVSARTQRLDRPAASTTSTPNPDRVPPPVSHDDPTMMPSDRHPTRPENATDSWDRLNLPGLPEHIGRFKVRRRLGAGGMGLVFEAHDQTLDRRVAVKLLRTDGSGSNSDEGSTRLLREAQALARLSHSNVIQVYEVGTFRGQVFVAMEYIDGETLDVWQRDPELQWPEILQVYLSAARGLAAAHEAGIVHRDFKPANVMRAKDGRVVVLDFGLARHTDSEGFDDAQTRIRAGGSSAIMRRARLEALRAEDSQALPEHLATPLTATGAVMGTPAYMSPEQHEGLPTDARTDQFSLCVALWEGLYGERPFEGPTLVALTSAVLEGRVRKVPEYSTQVPSYVQEALVRGLSVDPAERFDDLHELIDAIDRGPAAWARRRKRYLAAASLMGAAALAWGASGWEGQLDLGEERAAFEIEMQAADSQGARLGAQGYAAEASSHWDALVLGHAREALDRDPTEAMASLRHLTPGSTEWVASARIIASEARAKGAAWRARKLGVVSELVFSSLGDRVLFVDGDGGLKRWEVEADEVSEVEIEAGIRLIALAGHGRLGVALDQEGELFELNLGAEETRVSSTGVRPDCEATHLALDQEGQRLYLACKRRVRVWQRGGQGWRMAGEHEFDARILDVATADDELAVLYGHEQEANLAALRMSEAALETRELGLGIVGARRLVGAVHTADLAVIAGEGLLALPESPAQTPPVLRSGRAGELYERGAAGLVSADGRSMDVRTSTGSLSLRGHRAPIRFLRAARVEARLLSVDAMGQARVWRPGTAVPRIPHSSTGGVVALAISERGEVLIAGGGDGWVRRMRLDGGSFAQESLGKHPGELRAVYAAPDGARVASVGRESGIRVWSRPGEESLRFGVDRQAARSVQWSDDGAVVAAGSCTIAEGCGAELFWPEGERSSWIDGLDRAPIALSFAPEARRIAAVEPHESGGRLWLASLEGEGAREGQDRHQFERVDLEFGRIEAVAHDAEGWLTVAAEADAGGVELWRVDPKGRTARLATVPEVSSLVSDHGVVAWQQGSQVHLYDLVRHRHWALMGYETPLAAMMMRRGGEGVALFSELEDGALTIDLDSRERRRIDVREPPLAWGLDFFDAPGTSLRSFDDRAPQDPEALAEWIAAQCGVWVDPAKMHRSVLEEPIDEASR